LLISVSARGLTSLTTSFVWSDKPCWASSDTFIYTHKTETFCDFAKKCKKVKVFQI
jgi:hypothetical protein